MRKCPVKTYVVIRIGISESIEIFAFKDEVIDKSNYHFDVA